MGDHRMQFLPRTRNWRQVVGLLESDADVAQIAGATGRAAQRGLALATDDEGLRYAFWLLTQVPLAARQENLVEALSRIGVRVSAEPSVFEVAGAFVEAVDGHLERFGRHTDIGEMAELAAAEALTALCSPKAEKLWRATPEDARSALGAFSTRRQFGVLAHAFFSRFLHRFLTYHLSRELPNHLGRERRFAGVDEHNDFDRSLALHCRETTKIAAEDSEFAKALDLHCREASRIVQQFAGDWHSKATYESGIDLTRTRGFLWKALDKLQGELAKRGQRP